ncbi:hypothetical protein [Nannocystis sp. SCPEA4]|uniref:IS66 family transposase n=1 Tax=Nannocystis sp. SCPEA4 TaxID=2996787 RepID=UPI0022711133|nr:hypothetical protein [Nannocystis sp. SCPEA4]
MNEAAYRQLEARASKLEAVVDSLSGEREQLAAEREQYRKLYLQTLERCATLERGIVAGRQAERHAVDDSQLALQVLGMLLSPDEQTPAPDLSEETDPEVPDRERAPRRPTGRRKLPEHLPRVDIEVLPPEVQQEGLAAFKRIGEEVSEVIERRPESLVVVRLVRPKFVRIAEDVADPSPVKIA